MKPMKMVAMLTFSRMMSMRSAAREVDKEQPILKSVPKYGLTITSLQCDKAIFLPYWVSYAISNMQRIALLPSDSTALLSAMRLVCACSHAGSLSNVFL